MQLSANEIYQTSRKAGLAVGLTHDRAEDIAQATSFLQSAGYSGCAALANLFSAQLEAEHSLPNFQIQNTSMKLAILRPAIEGVAAIDWLLAEPNQGKVSVDIMVDPLIFAGLLWRAGIIYQVQFQLDFTNSGQQISLPDADLSGLAQMTEIKAGFILSQKSLSLSPYFVRACHSKADKTSWGYLEALAAKTYVPESELSRLSGAGAGLVDND